jgi:hypothetical protein
MIPSEKITSGISIYVSSHIFSVFKETELTNLLFAKTSRTFSQVHIVSFPKEPYILRLFLALEGNSLVRVPRFYLQY